MKRILASLALLFCFSAHADLLGPHEEWTAIDSIRQAAVAAAMIVDDHQTKQISTSACCHEWNPLLGAHPTNKAINLHFVEMFLGSTLIAYYLPERDRRDFQIVVFGAESLAIHNNLKLGFRVAF